MHPTRLLAWGAGFSLVVTAAALVFAPTAVFAADPPGQRPPGMTERPVSPGTNYVWGVPLDQLVFQGPETNKGGWQKRGHLTWGTPNPVLSGRYIDRTGITLREPYMTTGQLRIAASELRTRPENSLHERSYWSAFGYTAVCSSTQWTARGSSGLVQRTIGGTLTQYGGDPAAIFTSPGYTQNVSTGLTPALCPNLVSLNVRLTVYDTPWAANGAAPARTISTSWVADTAYLGTGYGDDSGTTELCEAGDNALDITCVDDPGNVKSNMCAGAPQPRWLDFDWLPRFVQHWTSCLFVPLGWDRESKVRDAQSHNSTITLISQDFPQMFEALKFETGCGQVATFDGVEYLDGLDINTCDWDISPNFLAIFATAIWFTGGVALLYKLTSLVTDLWHSSRIMQTRRDTE